MSDQPNQDQPTVPAWQTPQAQPEPAMQFEPTMPGIVPEPTTPLPGYPQGQQPGAASSGAWPGTLGGYGGSDLPSPVTTSPRSNGRTAVAIISALAVIGTAVAAVIYSSSSNGHLSPVSFPSGRPLPTGSASPTYPNPLISASPGPDTAGPSPASQTSEPGFDSPSEQAFDWNLLNESGSDPTPFMQDALLPQTLVDSQHITYELEAAGQKTCVQSTMSQDVQSVLREYNCKDAMTGSFLEDSSVEKVSADNDILVSVQIWPFPNSTTADKVEKALAGVGDKQFSIWCPTSGPGAAPCKSQNYYSAASWWSLQSEYRYVVEATAVYTNMTQDSKVAYAWEKTATAEAVKECGPQVYAESQ